MIIRVDKMVYERLKAQAEPFVDTPNSVLRRLLGLGPAAAEGDTKVAAHKVPRPSGAASRENRAPKTKSVSRSPRRRPARSDALRASAGTILPEERYELPVLQALDVAGGSASARSVLTSVAKLLEQDLTELDKELLGSGGIRWESRVQFVRLRLIDRGLMKRHSPRGVWEISDAGRRVVASRGKE
jgi:restriction system protein